MNDLPILYSFRRCPYAMRARMALWISGIACELREVKLADKPAEMIEASEKATVPVLVLEDGRVVDESVDIMRWALSRNDPEDWLAGDDRDWLRTIDGPFKFHLDRYKYWTRYAADPHDHRAEALAILLDLDARLAGGAQLCGESRSLVDVASFPFIRQFANHDRTWFDGQDLPHLQRWLDDHIASELFVSVMPKFVPWRRGDRQVIFGSWDKP